MGLTNYQILKLKNINQNEGKQARFKADLRIAEFEVLELIEVKDFDMAKANYGVKKLLILIQHII
jgi:hypothetical protein